MNSSDRGSFISLVVLLAQTGGQETWPWSSDTGSLSRGDVGEQEREAWCY